MTQGPYRGLQIGVTPEVEQEVIAQGSDLTVHSFAEQAVLPFVQARHYAGDRSMTVTTHRDDDGALIIEGGFIDPVSPGLPEVAAWQQVRRTTMPEFLYNRYAPPFERAVVEGMGYRYQPDWRSRLQG